MLTASATQFRWFDVSQGDSELGNKAKINKLRKQVKEISGRLDKLAANSGAKAGAKAGVKAPSAPAAKPAGKPAAPATAKAAPASARRPPPASAGEQP